MRETVPITAVWLRRIGSKVEVLVEIDKVFYIAIEENIDASFSHIAEGTGRKHWKKDYIKELPGYGFSLCELARNPNPPIEKERESEIERIERIYALKKGYKK